MRIEKEKLAKAIRLSQKVTSGTMKSDMLELQMFSLLIRDNEVSLLAQGDSGLSQVRVLAHVGREDTIEHGNYIIDGNRMLRVLNESTDEEVDVIFEEDEVVLKTSLGLTRYTSYSENLTTDLEISTNYDHVYEDIQAQISLTDEEGEVVDNEVWNKGLDVLRATTSDTISVFLLFYQDHVLLQAPYADVRYKVDFPFTVPFPIDVAQVLQDIVKYDTSDSKAYKENELLMYASDDVFMSVYGLGQSRTIRDKSWDITSENKVVVNTEELRQAIRVSDIFLESDGEDIIFEFQYQEGKLRILNKDEGSGADSTLAIDTRSEEDNKTIQVLGEVLQKALIITEDEDVELELLGGSEGMHIVYDEGDVHISYL